VRSILADLALLAFRRAVLGPLANALSGIFCGDRSRRLSRMPRGLSGHARSVPALAFVEAPRMHGGGWAGLKPDEVPTILQRGERVPTRREAAHYSRSSRSGGANTGITVHIDARGAQKGVAEEIDARLSAAMPQIRRAAVEAVAGKRKRGYGI
jgi:hypothetical protein